MDWLLRHFTVFGLEIQNWMLLVSFIFALWMFYIIAREPAGSNYKNQK